jgi:hypothetical protein
MYNIFHPLDPVVCGFLALSPVVAAAAVVVVVVVVVIFALGGRSSNSNIKRSSSISSLSSNSKRNKLSICVIWMTFYLFIFFNLESWFEVI